MESKGLKIAISGKGGSGKSTIAAIWARLLAARGNTVLAIDADPDANLASALGLPAELKATIRPLSQQDDLIRNRTGAEPGKTGQMFSLNPDVSDIAEKYGVSYKSVALVVLGAVKKGGGGCACPESAFLKHFVRHSVLRVDEAVILDMEAGIEHLGRGTVESVDTLVMVAEPGTRSLDTMTRIKKMASDLGIEKKLALILNKARNQEEEIKIIKNAIGEIRFLGAIPFDGRFVDADCEGKSILDFDDCGDLIEAFENSLKLIK